MIVEAEAVDRRPRLGAVEVRRPSMDTLLHGVSAGGVTFVHVRP